MVERSKQRQQDQLRELKFAFKSKLTAQLRSFEQQLAQREVERQRAAAVAAKSINDLQRALRRTEDQAAGETRTLEQTADARVHAAEQELAAKAMDFDRQLNEQKAAAEKRLRKVMENVQRVRETMHAQQVRFNVRPSMPPFVPRLAGPLNVLLCDL